MSSATGGGKDDRRDLDDSDEATRIIMGGGTDPGGDDTEDDATRILPMRPAAQERPLGTVIGVASEEPAASDDRTVFLHTKSDPAKDRNFDPAVGWLVITAGPGRGKHCSVYYGQSSIGRGEEQRIRLNFGDLRVARDAHAYIIYDDVSRRFFIRDNGKANLVRLNDAPVMSPLELKDRDTISIGDTVMMFVALCGPTFDWLASAEGPASGGRSS